MDDDRNIGVTPVPWGEIDGSARSSDHHREELIALIHDHEAPLYRLLLVLTGNRDVALDCVQDTFTRAFEHLKQGKTVNRAWLYRVGRNRAIDELRRRKREQRHQGVIEELYTESVMEDMVGIRQAFSRLSPDDRAILLLTVTEGLSGEEIAARLGIRHGAVRTRLQRARQRFRTLYTGRR